MCLVKHICPMFHQHLQYREVVRLCSKHHCCLCLQERTMHGNNTVIQEFTCLKGGEEGEGMAQQSPQVLHTM